MDMKTKLAGLMAQCLTDTWPDAQGLPTAEEIRGLLAVPPDPKMGDYALPVFRLISQGRLLSAVLWFVFACIAFAVTWLITLSLLPFGWFLVSIFACINAAVYRRGV